MKSLKKIHIYLQDLYYKMWEIFLRFMEIKKFKDPRRTAIYSKVCLSNKQKKQIDALFVNNYGQKIPYTWHRHYTAFTGNFDVNYFPELLYIPEFERFMNYNQSYTHVLSDKNLLPYLTQAAGISSPKVLLSCVEGIHRDANNTLLSLEQFTQIFSNLGEVFIKPSIDSSSGHGCAVINMKNGIDSISHQTSSQLLASLGDNFIIQERVVCHPSIAKMYPHSVNTFRIITYRWKEDICHMPIIMRIGRGGHTVDNAHAGGIFIAVDDNGMLHEKAFSEFNDQYTEHPDTHFIFKGYTIPYMDKLLTAAKQMHTLLPQLGCCNWDFTLNTQETPVLIEVNLRGGGIWPAQMSHGIGVFGNKTNEVLRWMAFIKNLPYSQRKFYKYGYMEKNF